MTQAWKQWEGQVIDGEFHLRQYLGGSEHSAVFLTGNPGRGVEKAAIKLIPADAANAELQFSQWKEAAKLSHPHLIQLYQTGSCQLGDRDLLYLVMEYAELDLSQVLSQGPFPAEETRETLRLILDTLAYLHGKGFVHGHLKPANIMSVDGRLKLSSDRICRMSKPSAGGGTPGVYDPPEAEVGMNLPAGDVWSLGMILVELAPEHPPVWVTTEEGDPVLPQSLPAPFYDIARNCLRWDPRRRWTVAEIRAQLAAAPVVPVQGPGAQTDARPQKVSAKRRYIVPIAVAGLALAAILASLKLVNHHHAQPKSSQNPMTREARPLTPRPRERQQSSSATRPSHPSPRSGTEAKAPTGGVVQGGVRQKVLPDASQRALDTIQGTIRVIVKVAVDPSGNVVDATLNYPGPSKYFARLALEAARKWKFQPAEVEGGPVSKEWLLQFDFEKTGMQARPVQAAP